MVSPYTLANRQKKDKTSDEDLLRAFAEYTNEISSGVKCCGNKCLGLLADNDICQPVNKFLFRHSKQHHTEQTQLLSEWYRIATAHRKANKANNRAFQFLLPYDATEATPEQLQKCKANFICCGALKKLFMLGQVKWEKICKVANGSAIAPEHKLKGKKGNAERSRVKDAAVAAVYAHLEEHCDLGEQSATRIVREATGETTLRDNDDTAIYLPMALTKRMLYRRYCEENGWQLTTKNSGCYESKWIGEGPPNKKSIVSWGTYRNIWRRDFSHLKISTKREDICSLCFVYANKQKYNSYHILTEDDLHSLPSACSRNTDESSSVGSDGDTIGSEDDVRVLDHENSDLPDVEIEFNEIEVELEDGFKGKVTADIIRIAVRHVRSAKAQRKMYRECIREAREHVTNNVPHTERHYVAVGDYCQNMEYPYCGAEQAGESYYYTPKSVYAFGLVDVAHNYDDMLHGIDSHMHAHVYEECVGGKGAANVASLLMRGLGPNGMDILDKGEPGGKLTIFFDNCVGQNKNNAVLELPAYLVECGYFQEVQFVFLVVGHTKNVCDRLFNNLKEAYHNEQIWTYRQLLRFLNVSWKVTVHTIEPTDFLNWPNHLKTFYRPMKGLIKQNHIFRCTAEGNTVSASGVNRINYEIIEADISDAEKVTFMICLRGRPQDLPNSTQPTMLPVQQMNSYMVVHMFDKWRKVVPQEHWLETCPEPTEEQMKSVKKEGKLRGALKEWKRSQKRAAVDELEDAIFDFDGMKKRVAKKAAAMNEIQGVVAELDIDPAGAAGAASSMATVQHAEM